MQKYLSLVAMLTLTACGNIDDNNEYNFNRLNPDTLNKHPYYSQVTTVSGNARFIYVAGQTDRAVEYKIGTDSCRHEDWRGQVAGVRDK